MGYLENLWNALDFGSLRDMVLRLVSVFLCLTVHETCHGLAALALGDPTAKRARRLSLNPAPHRLVRPADDGNGGLRLGQARAGGPPGISAGPSRAWP